MAPAGNSPDPTCRAPPARQGRPAARARGERVATGCRSSSSRVNAFRRSCAPRGARALSAPRRTGGAGPRAGLRGDARATHTPAGSARAPVAQAAPRASGSNGKRTLQRSSNASRGVTPSPLAAPAAPRGASAHSAPGRGAAPPPPPAAPPVPFVAAADPAPGPPPSRSRSAWTSPESSCRRARRAQAPHRHGPLHRAPRAPPSSFVLIGHAASFTPY
jgi:hypothetical protein